MTINVNFDTVANAISGLTISGVTVQTIAHIPTQGRMITPILYPLPNDFISNLQPVVDTFGTMGGEQMTLNYNMTYRYLHAPIAAVLDLSVYSGMITNIKAIAKAILSNDTLSGAANVRLSTISRIGPIEDPAGNIYHGCDFVIFVQEYT